MDNGIQCLWKGVHERMGDDVRPDLGISIEVLHACLSRLDTRYVREADPTIFKKVVDLDLFLAVRYSAGLRGEKMVKIDLYNLKLHSEDAMNDKHPFVPIPLLGRFKGETGTRHHILPIALEMSSGIKNGVWSARILKERREAGRQRGWLYATDDDKRMKASEMGDDLFELLERVQEETNYIPVSVDVRDEFGIYRSLRRGSTTHAINMEVSEADITRNNRWRKVEAAGNKHAGFSMMDHYTQIKQAIKAMLRYSQAL